MNQYQVFLAMEKKTILFWSIGSAGFVGLMGLVFVAMGGSEGLSDLAQSYPEEILEALGAEDITSVTGFLAAEFGSFAPIVFGIFLVMFVTKHLAGAEESGSIDHALARPVSRTTYYWHLLATGATAYGAILTTTAVVGILGFAAVASVRELLGIIGLMADLIPFGLVFLGLGGLFGALFHNKARANALGAAVVVLSFALDLISRLVDGATWLGYLTPHGYLARSDLANGEMDLLYVLVSLSVAALAMVAGWLVHERKQIFS